MVAYLLKFIDRTRVNTTALVDQMTSGCGLAAIDMAYDGSQLWPPVGPGPILTWLDS